MEPAQEEFPLKKIVLAALLAPASYARVLTLKSIPAILTLIGGYIAIAGFTIYFADNAAGAFLMLPVFIVGFVAIVFGYTVVAISFHRVFVLGADSLPDKGIREWQNRETRFFGWGLLVGMLSSLAMIPGIFLLVPVAALGSPDAVANNVALSVVGAKLLATLPAGYVGGRLGFVLPATATGRRPNLGWSLKLTRPYHWEAAFTVGIVPILFSTGLDFVAALLPKTIGLMLALGGTTYLMVVTIALLSFSYSFLTRTTGVSLPEEIGVNGKLASDADASDDNH